MTDRVNIPKERYSGATQRAKLILDGYMESHPNVPFSEWMFCTRKQTDKKQKTLS